MQQPNVKTLAEAKKLSREQSLSHSKVAVTDIDGILQSETPCSQTFPADHYENQNSLSFLLSSNQNFQVYMGLNCGNFFPEQFGGFR